ncbi:MAG: phosphatidate cytidylyltransferase [Sphingomonas fennica]
MTGATAAARGRDLRVRAVSGGVMIAVALAALALGGVAFWLLAATAGLLMVAEWGGLAHAPLKRISLSLLFFAAAMLIASPFLAGPNRDAVAMLLTAALAVALSAGGRQAAGLLYAGLPVIGLIFLRDRPDGIAITLWTLAIVWATDIGAYFCGRRFGGPRLAPGISPAKTWSGLIGGVASAAVLGAVVAAATGLPPMLLWLAAPLAVLAQMGDLFESFLKRRASVKDSGRLLPGHGGALDRLDGVVPVAMLVSLLAAAELL